MHGIDPPKLCQRPFHRIMSPIVRIDEKYAGTAGGPRNHALPFTNSRGARMFRRSAPLGQ